MTKKREFTITLISILIIMLLMYSIVFLFTNRNVIFAEGLDDLNENTIVNFNQLYSNYNYTETGSFSSSFINDSGVRLSINSSHIYYVSVYATKLENVNSMALYPYLSSSGSYRDALVISNINTKYSKLVTNSDFLTFIRYYGTSGNSFSVSFYINCIDLTTMFGSEISSSITIEQCNSYFTANYYEYNTGTPMPFSRSYLEGYAAGINDIYESMTIELNENTIGANAFAYGKNSNGADSSITYDQISQTYIFSGTIGIPFNYSIPAGTNISYDFMTYIADDENSFNWYINWYYVENGQLILLSSANMTRDQLYYIDGNNSFILTKETDTLYCSIGTIYNGALENISNITILQSDITFKAFDINLLIQSSYSRGYDAAMKQYEWGGTNYNAIYQQGRAAGLAEQNATLGAMEIASAAFTSVGDILRIELLPGMPLSAFVLIPLMLGLIFFVVKMAKGGS